MDKSRLHNLCDKFHLEDGVRVSLRNIIAHEMLSNTLIHREYTSPYYAKFVIERDKLSVLALQKVGDGLWSLINNSLQIKITHDIIDSDDITNSKRGVKHGHP